MKQFFNDQFWTIDDDVSIAKNSGRIRMSNGAEKKQNDEEAGEKVPFVLEGGGPLNASLQHRMNESNGENDVEFDVDVDEVEHDERLDEDSGGEANDEEEKAGEEDIPLIPGGYSTTKREPQEDDDDAEGMHDDGGRRSSILRVLRVYFALLSLVVFVGVGALANKYALPWWKARRSLLSCHCWNVKNKVGNKAPTSSSSKVTMLTPGRICLIESTNAIQDLYGEVNYYGDVSDEYFAASVDISEGGDVVAIGTTSLLGRGDVRLLEYKASWWRQRYVPLGPNRIVDPQDTTLSRFGESVSLSSDGKTLAVGRAADFGMSGLIYIYDQHQYQNKTSSLKIIKKDVSKLFGAPTILAPGNSTGGWGKHIAMSADGSVVAVSGMYSECDNEQFDM